VKQKRLEKLHKKIRSLEQGLAATQSRMDWLSFQLCQIDKGEPVLSVEMVIKNNPLFPPHHPKNTPSEENPLPFELVVQNVDRTKKIYKGMVTSEVKIYQ
jgi:hypothetical protein